MVQRCNKVIDKFVIHPAFNPYSSLPYRGEAYLKGENLGYPILQAKPFNSCCGKYYRVKPPFIKLSQSRIEVSPKLLNPKIGPDAQQLTRPPKTACPDCGALGQTIKILNFELYRIRRLATTRILNLGYERVPRIFPFTNDREMEAPGKFRGHVLHTVDRDIGLAP